MVFHISCFTIVIGKIGMHWRLPFIFLKVNTRLTLIHDGPWCGYSLQTFLVRFEHLFQIIFSTLYQIMLRIPLQASFNLTEDCLVYCLQIVCWSFHHLWSFASFYSLKLEFFLVTSEVLRDFSAYCGGLQMLLCTTLFEDTTMLYGCAVWCSYNVLH